MARGPSRVFAVSLSILLVVSTMGPVGLAQPGATQPTNSASPFDTVKDPDDNGKSGNDDSGNSEKDQGEEGKEGKKKGQEGDEDKNGDENGNDKGEKKGEDKGEKKGQDKEGKNDQDNSTKGKDKGEKKGNDEGEGKCREKQRGPPDDDGQNDTGQPERAGPPECSPGQSTLDFGSVNSSRSALALQIEAWRLLNESGNGSSAPDNSTLSAGQRARLQGTLESSFQSFVGANRVDNVSFFERSKEVAVPTSKRRPNVSAHVIVANQRVAWTATDDAERVYDQLQSTNVSFNESGTRTHIQKARRTLNQAQHVRQQSPNPVAAITHYKRAWNHAQAALDIMDASTEPRVNLTSRADPVFEGSTNYTVTGEVYDVRPWTIENVTITVDGENTTVPVQASNATPGHSGRFVARVELPARVVNVSVAATDGGTPTSDLIDAGGANRGIAALRLDGDGLPDTYEETVTGTDPLDPDSDARSTTVDEAENGTIDGREDFDDDVLLTTGEREVGTDPLDNDTDDDGLRDGYELILLETDPLSNDTDSDETPDGAEDPDGDGLSNTREQETGTNPTSNDSDGDGLADPDELHRGTDPSIWDTDEDDLSDGDELRERFGTDPLEADTNGNGVSDGNETYTTRTGNETLGVSVELTGPGNVADETRIENGTRGILGSSNDIVTEARVSPVVKVTTDADFEEATVSVGYDDTQVDNESALQVYRYDADRQRYVSLETEVDPASNTATARTEQFSHILVMQPPTFGGAFPDELPSEWSVDDSSQSGTDWNGDTAFDDGNLVVESNSSDGGGGGGGGNCDTTNSSLDCDDDGLTNGDELESNPYVTEPTAADTDGDGYDDYGELYFGSDPTDPNSTPETVSSTAEDEDTESSSATRTVDLDGLHGIDHMDDRTVTVAMEVKREEDGSDADTSVTINGQSLGGGVGGFATLQTTVSPDGSDLSIQVQATGDARVVVKRVRVSVDTDGDGLADNRESEDTLPTVAGDVETKPRKADSDGDGLTDGNELDRITVTDDGAKFELTSKPDTDDSDRDGLTDKEEYGKWKVRVDESGPGRPPIRHDEDGDDVVWHTSDPLEYDTDSDGITDSAEKEHLKTNPEKKETYLITEMHEQFYQSLYDSYQSTGQPTIFAKKLVAVGIIDSTAEMDRLDDPDLTDKTDDFDFVVKQGGSPLYRMVYRTPDGELRTDTWFSNYEEVVPSARTPMGWPPSYGATDPWTADSDEDGLTDGQEVKHITSFSGDTLIDYELSAYETDPHKTDTDRDGAIDGGGYVIVGNHEIGRQAPKGESERNEGEVWDLPTRPGRPDVVDLAVALDEEWRGAHRLPRSPTTPRHKARRMIKSGQSNFNENFDGDDSIYFYFRVVEWIDWNSNDSKVGMAPGHVMKKDLKPKADWSEKPYESDVLVGFSYQRMGSDKGKDYLDSPTFFELKMAMMDGFPPKTEAKVDLSEFADGVSHPRVVLVGANDITAWRSSWINRLFTHEMGHVYDADHPGDENPMSPGTPGVMCKYSCGLEMFQHGMLATSSFNPTNKEDNIQKSAHKVPKAHYCEHENHGEKEGCE